MWWVGEGKLSRKVRRLRKRGSGAPLRSLLWQNTPGNGEPFVKWGISGFFSSFGRYETKSNEGGGLMAEYRKKKSGGEGKTEIYRQGMGKDQ